MRDQTLEDFRISTSRELLVALKKAVITCDSKFVADSARRIVEGGNRPFGGVGLMTTAIRSVGEAFSRG